MNKYSTYKKQPRCKLCGKWIYLCNHSTRVLLVCPECRTNRDKEFCHVGSIKQLIQTDYL